MKKFTRLTAGAMARLFVLALALAAPLAGLPVDSPPEKPKPREFRWEGLGALAIQDRGRLKPLATFAEESVLFVTGRRSWNDMPATEVIFGWLIAFDREWEDEPFVRVDHGPLKKALGLDVSRKHFTFAEIEKSTELARLVRSAAEKEARKERQTDIEKKAIQLQNQRSLVEAITSGQALNLFPNPHGLNQPWYPLSALTDRSQLPYADTQLGKLSTALRAMLDAFVAKDAGAWERAVGDFSAQVREFSGGHYPSAVSLNRELHYQALRPFHWSWVLYAVVFVFLVAAIVTQGRLLKIAGLSVLALAFGIHSYGFVLRCLIAGRPPVTNMYESVIWVTWGCVLFAGTIWGVYRHLAIPAASTVFAVVGLVLADNVPLVLDPGIHPLEPVLRSNFWLTIHVLTITLSYAAFALSLCLGNVVLGQYLFRPGEVGKLQLFSLYMYRAMQIGVVLLAAGTILGGVWADYSWGRFWGWDPKEVWALIALLLYLAVLHGRFTGWLKGFGFAATTVLSFLGVLMAWYGVNFVLGVGLHSYGFGSGGMGYVMTYVLLQLGFIAAAYARYRREGQVAAPIFPKG